MSGRDNFLRDVPWTRQPQTYPPIAARFRRGLSLAFLGTEQRPVDRSAYRVGVLRFDPSVYTQGSNILGRTINTSTGSGRGVQFNTRTETVSSCTIIIGLEVSDTWNVYLGFEADNNTYIGGNGSGQINVRQGGTDVAGGSISANTPTIIGVSFSGTTMRVFKNGVFQFSGTGGSTAFSSTWNFGGNSGGGGTSSPKIAFAYVWDRPLSDSDQIDLGGNPWKLFASLPRRIFLSALAGGGDQTVTLGDTGAGADALAIAVNLAMADTGAGAEGFGAAASVPLADTGAGADAVAITVTFTVADTGAGADAVTIITAELKTIADTGAGSDSLAISVAAALTETGAGADGLTIAASLTLADTGSGADALSVITETLISIAESFAAVDAVGGITVAVTLAESASGADALALQALVSVLETASGLDVAIVVNPDAPRIVRMVFTPRGRSVTFTLH